MENFIVSARKYRPITFESVVGQLHITNTLKNAIKNNQLAQAFLFCGPRGVGKTTCARILAKTINCTQLTVNGEACGACDSCISFQHGNSFNFHELDAASNNSVDDIRNLIDQVRIPPQAGKYKVYIIDEVHMLSQSAFNAFLKTLEEPPSYAIFILATTEKHKILPTILSRCQIFDFNRIKVEDMANHLKNIATRENIAFDEDGLHVIAQKADGGLRDALSMFDQIVSFSNRQVNYSAVIANLNILDYDYFFKITDFLLLEDTANSLLLFNEILNNGFDGNHFITGLSNHFRNILVCKDASTVQLLEVSEGVKQKYLEQASKASTSFIISALNISNQCDLNYKISKNQRLQVELTLIKISHLPAAINLNLNGKGKNTLSDEKKKSENLNQQQNHKAVETVPQKIIEQPVIEKKQESFTKKATEQPKQNTALEDKKAINIAGNLKSISLKNGGTLIPNLKNPTGINKEIKEDVEVEFLTGEAKSVFTFEQFSVYWKEFADKAKQEGKISLGTLMTNYTPVLKENFLVELPLENKLQATELISGRIDLLNFLRVKLQNFALMVEPLVTEIIQERKLYTSRDKYLHLIEKNPELENFRKAFNLDVDA